MIDQPDSTTHAAKCPRCGYDLRGAIETWREQCPLTGRCNECGLDIKWAEVLHPEKFEPLWCVEFARAGNRLSVTCGKTYIRSFWPFCWCLQFIKSSKDQMKNPVEMTIKALLESNYDRYHKREPVRRDYSGRWALHGQMLIRSPIVEKKWSIS